MKTKLAILASIGVTGTALAAPQTFDFKDPKGINNAGFKLDAPLEAINGNASGVSGTVTFDPANPAPPRAKSSWPPGRSCCPTRCKDNTC